MITDRNIYFALLLGLLLLAACKKDENSSKPEISLYSPVEYASFYVGDTMPVVGRVAHNNMISSIKIVIKDKNTNPVTIPQFLYPNSYTYDLNFGYPIDANALESGMYTLVITATDGSNSSNLFRNIMITGEEKLFEAAVVITRPSILKTYVYSIGWDWELENILNTDFGFTHAELSSRIRKLMLTKPNPSKLLAYDLDDIEEDEWLAAEPPYPLFNDILYDDMLTYVASANGDIKGVNQLGSTVYVTPLNSDTIPYLLHRYQNYMLSYCERRGGPERFLTQHYMGTGVFRTTSKIDFSIVSMFSMETSGCILFGKHEEGCSIYEYHPDEPYLNKMRDLPAGNLIDVVDITSGNYLLAHSAGILYFSANNGHLWEWKPGFQTEIMSFDQTRGLLFCAYGQDISVFRIDTGELVKEFKLSYPVYDLFIQYNI